MNRLYSMFSARNPYFMNKSGKISIIAHSLGCVILYDIIMGLKPGSLVQNNQQGLLFQVSSIDQNNLNESFNLCYSFFFSGSKFLLLGISPSGIFSSKVERLPNSW